MGQNGVQDGGDLVDSVLYVRFKRPIYSDPAGPATRSVEAYYGSPYPSANVIRGK